MDANPLRFCRFRDVLTFRIRAGRVLSFGPICVVLTLDSPVQIENVDRSQILDFYFHRSAMKVAG